MVDKLFFYDPEQNTQYYYQEFIDDLNKSNTLGKYIYTKNYYKIFLQLVLSIIYEKEIILLDYDFTKDEIKKLGIKEEDLQAKVHLPSKKDINLDNLVSLLFASINWRITLFTSGTTGLPKKISHNFSNLTRMVKIDANRKENIWGFAYNPTHFAGLQVFFQAFLNLNTIVFLFNRPQNEINNSIERFKISHISATPTFYRMILSAEKQFLSVTRITSGGEKFDQSLKEKVKCTFPNAKITNVYASTEAGTLFAAKDEVFIVKEDYREFVRIENSELLIHKNLMGESTDLFLENEWYRTGDMVQIESVNPLVFRFVNRKNEIINVGGYKINPYEVENAIMEINGISNCRVYGKKNSVIGNILIAEVQKSIESLTEREILSELKKKLQTFKLPRMIKFVDKLELTRTGKLKRQ